MTYVLDTAKPKVTISKPTKNQVVNGDTVTILGKTQAGSSLVARNTTNGASITGKADAGGAFKLVLAISSGTNSIVVTATDPAGNQGQAAVNVSRGKGKLTAELTSLELSVQPQEPAQEHHPDGHRHRPERQARSTEPP